MVAARSDRSAAQDDKTQKAVHAYIEGTAAENRPLLDRLLRLVREARPDAAPGMSYGMLCYRVGDRRLFIGSWKHGLSIYGWPQGSEVVVTSSHPGLKTSKGTIRISPAAAADVSDDELRSLVHAALDD